jgi:putative ABC transport system permease protein
MLAKNPGFTVIVLVILAVGIGANTAIFSVVNAVMLRPLSYEDPERIVAIEERDVPEKERFRYGPNFLFLRENNQSFESLAGYCGRLSYVTGIEKPHEVRSVDVTWNLFSFLGVRPLLGRTFVAEDEAVESTRVVVLSHTFWQEHLGGSPDVLGKSINLNEARWGKDYKPILEPKNYTIVGVMPPEFSFPAGYPIPFWTPTILSQAAAEPYYPQPVLPLARLKKGVSPEQADAELRVLADHLHRTIANTQPAAGTVHVRRLLDRLVEGHRRIPLLLLGAAGFVLLIACGNVANLFLARATVRQREMAMRVALGASRGRVLRQMLTESLLLSLGAGVLGLLLTLCTIQGLVHLCPSDTPRLQEADVDLSVLGFTLGVSTLTGLLFGMAPAWRASGIRIGETLKEGTGRTTRGRGWRRLHNGLVVSQVGLSLVLLVGSALLIRSLVALQTEDLGFHPEQTLAVEIRLPLAKYAKATQPDAFFLSLLDRVRALPQVQSAAAFSDGDATDALGSNDRFGYEFSIEGQDGSRPRHTAEWNSVTPGFFDAMGIRLLKGRTLADRDSDGVVIDEKLARECFPDVDPIGQRLVTGDNSRTVVGVVATIRNFSAMEPVYGMVYEGVKDFREWAILLVRTDGDPMRLAPAIRTQVGELEADPVIKTLEPLETTLSQMLASHRFVMVLLSLFAGVALIVASIGVYGLLQYSTAQQVHDIGVRMALGARSIDILRAVLGRGLKLTLLGVAVGLAGAVALTRLLSSLLYGVTPTDAATFGGVSLVLVGVALVAAYLPARRAAKVDPMTALRSE